jgi:hypothetical protein
MGACGIGQSITVSFAFFEKEFCTVPETSRNAYNTDPGRQMVTPNCPTRTESFLANLLALKGEIRDAIRKPRVAVQTSRLF